MLSDNPVSFDLEYVPQVANLHAKHCRDQWERRQRVVQTFANNFAQVQRQFLSKSGEGLDQGAAEETPRMDHQMFNYCCHRHSKSTKELNNHVGHLIPISKIMLQYLIIYAIYYLASVVAMIVIYIIMNPKLWCYCCCF